MKIRYANSDDDKLVLAGLIYETDRYIYPYWFKDKQEGVSRISELLNEKTSIFYYKNCIVAEIDGDIVGLILFYKNDGTFTYDYEKYINISFESSYVIKNYVLKLQNEVKDNTVYIYAVRVKDEFARKGIACKMLEFVFDCLNRNTVVEIDVLVENLPAVNLYKKVGFNIVKEYKGFNGYRKKKVPCYFMRMTRV